MGRASRRKQQRRPRPATFRVTSPGMLEVLSIGRGDLKIAIGDSNQDRADAQHLIEEMLRKGYTLFVETKDGPLKVTRFLPDQMAYVVAGTPDVVPGPPQATDEQATREHMRRWARGEESHPGEDDDPAAADSGAAMPEPPATPAPKGRGKRTVPVAGSRTTAIGRTAGG